MQLPILPWGCDRAGLPDRIGALIASCAYADAGIITSVATGKRGMGANREVSSVTNEVEVQDYPILGTPGAKFLNHATPEMALAWPWPRSWRL